MKTRSFVALSLIVSLALLLPAGRTPTTAQGDDTTERVSVACDGTQSNEDSVRPSISHDGRYVTFISDASNLVSGDTNSVGDVFAHDRQTGEITRVSVASDGTEADDYSQYPSISATGHYVAFMSYASNLVSGDTNGMGDVFVHDRQTGQTTRVSVASDGTQAIYYDSSYPSISSDGRYVAFSSASDRLAPVETVNRSNIFVHDRQTGQTTCISRPPSGTQENLSSYDPAISADGRFVAFSSSAGNLVSGDTNYRRDIFVYDMQTDGTTRVSLASDGTEASGDSEAPEISADGRYVAFRSWADNLVSGDTNGANAEDIFVHDRDTDEDGVFDEQGHISTVRVSVATDGTQSDQQCWDLSISGDGRYVAFDTTADTLVSDDTNSRWDIFVHDTQTSETTRVSVASDGTQGNHNSRRPSLSYDGSSVAFDASADNLASNDTNGFQDVFVHGQWSGVRRFAGLISPVYPTAHTTDSTVMQGGVAYRYFHLSCADGSTSIPNATVTFSGGSTTGTDADGYFTFTVVADSLGSPGSYSLNVQSITVNDQTYSTSGSPSFTVQVSERRYAHSWSYGAIRRASAGVNTGLIAYVRAETNGGLGLTLDESDPDRTDDDQVEMKETYSVEAGGGVGVGLRENVSAGVVKANLDASVTSEASLRGFGSLRARFDQPYADADRKAQGIFLLLSACDSVAGRPSQPLVIGMLRAAEASLPYLNYITAQSAGMAAKVTPLHGHAGAEVGLSARRDSSEQAKAQTVGFTLLDVGVSRLVAAVLTDYGTEYSVGFEDELSVNLTALSPDIPGIQNRLVGLIGNQSRHIHKEYFYDSATGQLKRIELTLSSEGNASAFTDVTKKKVAVRVTIPAGSLNPSLIESVGEAQALSDLETLLQAEPQIAYEVQVEDGSSVSVVPELAIPGTEIMVGLGLEVESLRSLVRERGVFLNGEPYVTETYNADGYVDRSGKDWADLTQNALGGLWLLVKDAFNWVGQQVESGTEWALDVYAETTEGIRQGWAQLWAPPSSQLQIVSAAGGLAVQATEAITVTATSWVPESGSGTSSLALHPAMETSTGAGFVVGGIYTFQPYTMTVTPAATLTITYTDEAVAGVDESHIGMFHWNPDGNNWQPVTAQADTDINSFTASITQLGTFALGYDDTSPEITVLDPPAGSTSPNALPLISALAVDTGVGIDPATVEMQLDEQVVAGTYITGTGELVYLPDTLLTLGVHTVTVSAADVVGNSASTSVTFEVAHRVYLPLVLR